MLSSLTRRPVLHTLSVLAVLPGLTFLTAISQCESSDADGDDWTTQQGDCNDQDASVYPGAQEVCDGVDQDCDGLVDEDIPAYASETFLASGLDYVLGLRINPANGQLLSQASSGVDAVTPEGTQTLVSDSLIGYSALAVGSDGALYFWTGEGLFRQDKSGKTLIHKPLNGVAVCSMNMGPDQNLYVAYYIGRNDDGTADRAGLTLISPSTGESKVLFEKDYFSVPTDLAVDSNLNVYIADPNYQQVYKYNPSAGASVFVSNLGTFNMAVDKAGYVYTANVKLAPDGSIVSSGFATSSYGLAVEPSGEVIYTAKGEYLETGWDFGIVKHKETSCN